MAVHGGAGHIPERLVDEHQSGCARAVEAGASLLDRGGAALDAVCAAVRVLEDDPLYNAGRGSALDQRGVVALDAAVMRGSDLALGAVGAVVGVKNAVDAARLVLEDAQHCLLVGPAAAELARARGCVMVSPDRLQTERSRRAYERRVEASTVAGASVVVREPELVAVHDAEGFGNTVGAVARDVHGHVAAATSTGGLLLRLPGRLGDSPIAGAGTYARDDLGALSATGHGETMMRTVFAYQALLDLHAAPPDEAPEKVLLDSLETARRRVGGSGGAIVVLPQGTIAFARNTPRMGVAWRRAGEDTRTAV